MSTQIDDRDSARCTYRYVEGVMVLGMMLLLLGFQSAVASSSEPVPVEVHLRPEAPEPWNTGWSVNLDNDLFAGKGHDRDYTAGATVTLSGRRAKNHPISMDRMLGRLDGLSRFGSIADTEEISEEGHALQFGFLLFTPDDILAKEAIIDDRPYANLAFLANSRYTLNSSQTILHQSTITVGVLGTGIGEAFQSAVHDLIDGNDPQGYSHQISDGGELTARYSVARHTLLSIRSRPRLSYDMTLALEGSAGYLTEGSVALGIRWGRIRTPWWMSVSEYADHPSQPTPTVSKAIRGNTKEIYFSAGVKLRARVYNVFLQGQFRDSDVEFSSSQVEPLLLEGWLGMTTDFRGFRIQYALRYQTAELKQGVGARNLTWAGITVSKSF